MDTMTLVIEAGSAEPKGGGGGLGGHAPPPDFLRFNMVVVEQTPKPIKTFAINQYWGQIRIMHPSCVNPTFRPLHLHSTVYKHAYVVKILDIGFRVFFQKFRRF